MLGADGGLGQAELWSRVRATPAGRELLARGPGAYGLRDAASARAWVDQYRAFRAAPTVSVTGGDFPVPAPGGLTLTAAGTGRVKVVLGRAGNAVVTMTPARGGKVRAIRKLVGPASGVVVRLPTDSRPGLYRIQADPDRRRPARSREPHGARQAVAGAPSPGAVGTEGASSISSRSAALMGWLIRKPWPVWQPRLRSMS